MKFAMTIIPFPFLPGDEPIPSKTPPIPKLR